MSEMVERVARLLVGERDEPNPADNGRRIGDDGTCYPAGIARWKAHEKQVREIIAAMREPTDAMEDEGASAIYNALSIIDGPHGEKNAEIAGSPEAAIAGWRAMIDEALR